MKNFIVICMLFLRLFAYADENTMVKIVAMQNFNIKSYVGTWYEIARLPFNIENQCVREITMTYTLKRKKVLIGINCITNEQDVMKHGGNARFTNGITVGKFRANFSSRWLSWFGYGSFNYWVLDTDYTTYAVIGSPDHEYAWVLSRTPDMEVKLLQKKIGYLQDNNYDVSSIIYNKAGIE